MHAVFEMIGVVRPTVATYSLAKMRHIVLSHYIAKDSNSKTIMNSTRFVEPGRAYGRSIHFGIL